MAFGGSRWKEKEKWKKCFFGRREGEVLKAVRWNIAGVGNVGVKKDFLQGFDIICLQETWLEDQNKDKVFN